MHFIISLPQLSNSPTPKHADITILSRKKGACGELDGVTEIPTLGTYKNIYIFLGYDVMLFYFSVFSLLPVSLKPGTGWEHDVHLCPPTAVLTENLWAAAPLGDWCQTGEVNPWWSAVPNVKSVDTHRIDVQHHSSSFLFCICARSFQNPDKLSYAYSEKIAGLATKTKPSSYSPLHLECVSVHYLVQFFEKQLCFFMLFMPVYL